MILPRAATEQAISRMIGGAPLRGRATAKGLLPSIASDPPQGTMWLMAPMAAASFRNRRSGECWIHDATSRHHGRARMNRFSWSWVRQSASTTESARFDET